MSVLRRLVNVAKGKVKTTFSAEPEPAVPEVEALRPRPAPSDEPAAPEPEEPPAPKPAGPRPRRL